MKNIGENMKPIDKMFSKPDLPVEIRIPHALSVSSSEHGIPISRAIKTAIYAMLMAHEDGVLDIELFTRKRIDKDVRTTVRIPVGAYDQLRTIFPDVTINIVLSNVACLFADNEETFIHV